LQYGKLGRHGCFGGVARPTRSFLKKEKKGSGHGGHPAGGRPARTALLGERIEVSIPDKGGGVISSWGKRAVERREAERKVGTRV